MQADQQVHDLCLDGDIQCRGRLVGNQQLGVAGNRHGDYHPLAHAARQLVRKRVQPAFGRRDFHHFHQLHRPCLQRAAAQPLVQPEHFHDLEAHRIARVQAGHRILEDHGDVAADNAPPRPLADGQQVLAVKLHAVGLDVAVAVQQAHQRHHGDRLAGTGFTDDADDLAGLHRQVHPFYCIEPAKADRQVGDFQQTHVVLLRPRA